MKLSIGFFGLILVSSWASAKDLAKINEVVLTDKDLIQSLSGMNPIQRDAILKDPVSRKQWLDQLISREVLAQEGEKLEVDKDAEFKELMANLRKQALMSRVIEKNVASQMTQSAAKKYYEQHRDEYSTDRVRVQQIVLSGEAEARKVLKLTEDPKNSFQDLAEKYSIDPEAKNNRGELGYIGHDRLDPEFVKVAFTTGEGKVAGPVHTIFGYHLIKVIHKQYGKALEFHEVELPVRNALRQSLANNYIEKIKSQNKITLDQAAVEKF